VKNEREESDSGPGHADSGTEHSRPEAEAQYKKIGRSGTAEKDGGNSCPVAGGAGQSGTPLNCDRHARRRSQRLC